MFKRVIRQANFNGVSDGSRATVQMGSLGSTVHNGTLTFKKAGGVLMTSAEIVADVDYVEVTIDGNVKFTMSAQFAFDFFNYYNDANNVGNPDGQLNIPFACQDYLSEAERAVLAYGTGTVDSFLIEIQFKTVGGGFLTQTVEFRTQLGSIGEALGQHRKIRRYRFNYNGLGGQQDITELPNRIPNMSYKSLFIEEGTSSLDFVTLKISTSEIFKDVTPELNDLLNGMHGRTNQAGYYTLDFNLDANLSGGINMINVADFRQELTWAGAAGGYFIYSEEIWDLRAKVSTKK